MCTEPILDNQHHINTSQYWDYYSVFSKTGIGKYLDVADVPLSDVAALLWYFLVLAYPDILAYLNSELTINIGKFYKQNTLGVLSQINKTRAAW